MRRYFKLCTAVLLILLPGSIFAGNAHDPSKIVDTNTCAECHESAIEVWRNTKHFNTYGQLHRGKKAREFADALGISVSSIRRPDSECASCHYTVGESRGRERVVAGISCQSCHGAAADWVEIHNEYGGPGVTKESESEAHKSQRYKAMHDAGMVYPADLYGLANNCFQCHLIANEKLINGSEHPTSSSFDLVERSQGNIKHYPAADAAKKNKLAIAGIAAQTVQGLKALANAAPGTRFASEMESTVKQAASQFNSVAQQLNDGSLQKIASLLNEATLSAGNSKLASLSAKIDEAATAIVGVEGSVSKSNNVAAIEISKPAPQPKAPAPKPEPKPQPKPEPKSEPKPEPKPQPKPEPKPQPKPKPAPKPAPKPKPAAKKAAPLGDVLISELSLRTPRSPAYCKSLTPWSRGFKTVSLATEPNACIGIEVKKSAQTTLSLFAVTGADTLVRLLPNTCSYLGVNQQMMAGDTEVALPANANNQPVTLSLPQGLKAVYAVVASEEKAAPLLELNSSVPDVCGTGSKDPGGFESSLGKLNKASANHVQWRKAE